MKTLSALIVGGALTLGIAMAQDAPKPAAPAAPATKSQTAAKSQTKVKKHRHHKKSAAATAAPTIATPAKK